MKTDQTGIEKYAIESIPCKDWTFTHLLDDIIMCEFADADKDGVVMRNGIALPTDASRAVWRVGKVLMKGDDVPDWLEIGNYVMFPNDRGIKSTVKDGSEVIFLNVDRIFAVVEPA